MVTLNPKQLETWKHRIVDVREPDEFAAERLACPSVSVPLGRLVADASGWSRGEPLLLVCKGGTRARQAATQLEGMAFEQIHLLEGGLDACKKAGVAVVSTKAPIPIFRQVMLAAGLFLLAGLALSLVHPAFLLLDLVVALGLTMAGLTGLCPMARLLERMPWNVTGPTSGAGCSRTGACKV